MPFLIVGLIGGEVLGQLWFPNPLYYFEYRLTYISPDAIRNVGNFWTYRPNAQIHEVLIYKKPFAGFVVESSCEYTTDENGFLENRTEVRQFDWLIVGDSFTAGQGGCSWMARLRALVPHQSIYNAALMGTGIEHWAEFMQYLVSRGYSFKNIMVLFIPGDFYRQVTPWRQSEIACLHDTDLCRPGYFYYPWTGESNLVATSEQRLKLSFYDEARYFWKRNLWVSYYLAASARRWWRGEPKPQITATTIAAFERMLNAAQPVRFVRIPGKDEVALGADNAWWLPVNELFRNRNLQYELCSLEYADFPDYDGHPNRAGYARLAECVAAKLNARRY